MLEYFHQTADAGVSLSDSGCKSLHQTTDAGVSPSDRGCRSIAIRQRMQVTLYQTADAGNTLLESG